MTCVTTRRGKSRRPRIARTRHDIMICIVPRVSVPTKRIAHGRFKSFPSARVFCPRRCNGLGRRRCWVSIIIMIVDVYIILGTHSVCMYSMCTHYTHICTVYWRAIDAARVLLP